MGQSPLVCGQQQSDFLTQQVQIYRWRADTTVNAYLPRCSFRPAHLHRQQTLLSQILSHQPQQSPLQIGFLRQQLSASSPPSQQDIILFEAISCSLDKLGACLEVGEAAYALEGLIRGYGEVRKMFGGFPVDAKCCFVSERGEVKAWINPNFKSNLLPNPHSQLGNTESSLKKIIRRVIELVESLTAPRPESELFFNFLHNLLNSQAARNNNSFKIVSVDYLIRSTHNYCFQHNIQPSPNLIKALHRKEKNQFLKHQLSEMKLSLGTTSKGLLKSTIISDRMNQSSQSSMLLKVKSLQKQSSHFVPTANKEVSRLAVRNSIQKNPLMPPTKSSPIPVPPQKSVLSPKPSRKGRPMRNTMSERFEANEGLLKSNSQVNPIISHSQYINPLPFQPQCIQINYKPPKLSKYKAKVSIVENKPGANKQNNPTAKGISLHNPSLFNGETPQGSVVSRKWMTNKTITKLVSEHESSDGKSIVSSLQQSQDQYGGSEYSGVLTTMGRDAMIDSELSQQSSLKSQ